MNIIGTNYDYLIKRYEDQAKKETAEKYFNQGEFEKFRMLTSPLDTVTYVEKALAADNSALVLQFLQKSGEVLGEDIFQLVAQFYEKKDLARVAQDVPLMTAECTQNVGLSFYKNRQSEFPKFLDLLKPSDQDLLKLKIGEDLVIQGIYSGGTDFLMQIKNWQDDALLKKVEGTLGHIWETFYEKEKSAPTDQEANWSLVEVVKELAGMLPKNSTPYVLTQVQLAQQRKIDGRLNDAKAIMNNLPLNEVSILYVKEWLQNSYTDYCQTVEGAAEMASIWIPKLRTFWKENLKKPKLDLLNAQICELAMGRILSTLLTLQSSGERGRPTEIFKVIQSQSDQAFISALMLSLARYLIINTQGPGHGHYNSSRFDWTLEGSEVLYVSEEASKGCDQLHRILFKLLDSKLPDTFKAEVFKRIFDEALYVYPSLVASTNFGIQLNETLQTYKKIEPFSLLKLVGMMAKAEGADLKKVLEPKGEYSSKEFSAINRFKKKIENLYNKIKPYNIHKVIDQLPQELKEKDQDILDFLREYEKITNKQE